ncbi:preprotein translocase subunit SecG [Helicobacter muridarum]|uniref:Protein-export membrane protein SecG n=1 Tax=Helicobacter muridarum TaxID=216 RepID=A0A377PU95_9HELI|nr:preprotein translocase subunit SecG [Helicobacter muridarum]STQ86426.1 preprotein translocase subunit SecG [Helicobacter muridarum]
MTNILIIIQIILSVSIVVVVLLQKSSSIGLGAYSGSNESLFGAKGPANFMAKVTMFLGIIFIVNTIGLSYLYNIQSSKSVIDDIDLQKSLPISVPFDSLNSSNTTPLSNPNLNATQPILTPTLQSKTQQNNTQSNNIKNPANQ